MMIFDQSLTIGDIPRVVALAFLEMLLSADNAIVLSLITKPLASALRSRALYIGFLSAFFFRFLGILGIAFLFKYPFIQALGALYLLYLSLRHFIKKRKKETLMPRPVSFWGTILMVELFDLAFAIDSIVAGLAFIGSSAKETHPKLWIVYVGGMIGVFGIRYAAHFFSYLMDRFSRLKTSAYLMIGWIGLKLGILTWDLDFPYIQWIFWGGLIILFAFGFIRRKESHV